MSSRFLNVLALAGLLLGAAQTDAATMTYFFKATKVGQDSNTEEISGGAFANVVTGSFTLDDTMLQNLVDPNSRRYFPVDVSADFGIALYQSTLASTYQFDATQPNQRDVLQLLGPNLREPFGQVESIGFRLTLLDNDGQSFSGIDFLTIAEMQAMADFRDSDLRISITDPDAPQLGGATVFYDDLQFSATSFTPVPAPPAILLGFTGLFGLAWIKRRRLQSKHQDV